VAGLPDILPDQRPPLNVCEEQAFSCFLNLMNLEAAGGC
jgi:hypothetical protein